MWNRVLQPNPAVLSREQSSGRVKRLRAAGCKVSLQKLPDGSTAVLIDKPMTASCKRARAIPG